MEREGDFRPSWETKRVLQDGGEMGEGPEHRILCRLPESSRVAAAESSCPSRYWRERHRFDLELAVGTVRLRRRDVGVSACGGLGAAKYHSHA